jgi:hypothetical protein
VVPMRPLLRSTTPKRSLYFPGLSSTVARQGRVAFISFSNSAGFTGAVKVVISFFTGEPFSEKATTAQLRLASCTPSLFYKNVSVRASMTKLITSF